MQDDRLAIGIDAGTGGVRAIAVSTSGVVAAAAKQSFPPPSGGLPRGWREQDPESWWTAARSCLAEVAGRLGKRAEAVAALAVDGTSGTLVCLNGAGEAVRPALMYNDSRAAAEAEELCALAAGHCRRHGYRFAPSFAAARVLWLLRHEPETVAATRWFGHQSDYIAARLGARCGVSDYSNALKTGFDLFEERWPNWVGACEGMGERLPEVVAPGARLGELSQAAASATGLPAGAAVVAGATDGTAAFLASGAHRPGDDNITLGTTLVFKRLASSPGASPDGLVYSHKLPGGYWLPGAASNTGGGVDRGAVPRGRTRRRSTGRPSPCFRAAWSPTRWRAPGSGSRSPAPRPRGSAIRSRPLPWSGTPPTCRGWLSPNDWLTRCSTPRPERVTATSMRPEPRREAISGCSCAPTPPAAPFSGRPVRSPPSAARSWRPQLFSAACGRRPGPWCGPSARSARAMVRTERTFAPDQGRGAVLDEHYAAFREALEKRGYLEAG